MKNFLCSFICFVFAFANAQAAVADKAPNIVYILADDLGYGDVKCLNPKGKIETPNMDKIAAGGMTFTDAHGSSSVCTPTRYGILTGRYNWRSALKSGVLNGFDAPLIEPDRLTIAGFLKEHGYQTACIGKWHLGMNMPFKKEAGSAAKKKATGGPVDYSQTITRGPNAAGFDYFFGISASVDMPPYIFIENDRFLGEASIIKSFYKNRKGPAEPAFEAEEVLDKITGKAVEYIDERAADAKNGKPFFLYFALTAPHTPVVPTDAWKGKSRLGAYGDFVMQADACVGRVLDALKKQGLADNTIVILTSDNGFSPAGAHLEQLVTQGHNPSYIFRGTKADIFDGGHRIPFLVKWPGVVKPGSTSDQLTCLTDLLATCADMLGAKLPDTAGEDSVSMLPALKGTATEPLRETIVHHSIDGNFAIRKGPWKLILCSHSGGWSDPKPRSAEAKKLPPVQLYNLSEDIGEKHNLQAEHPEIVTGLTKLLETYVANGRSTPGAPQKNTGEGYPGREKRRQKREGKH